MHRNQLDIHNEFLVYRTGFGFKLTRPDQCLRHEHSNKFHSIQNLFQLPFTVFVNHGKNFSLQRINEFCAHHCGFDSPISAKGKIAHDYMTRECANHVYAIDQEVVSKNKIKIAEYQLNLVEGAARHCFTIRSPLYNHKNRTIGILGFCIHPGEQPILDSFAKLKEIGLLKSDLVAVNNEKFGVEIDNIYFSKRETDCIRHLVKGKTAKQTALILGLSYRTVENYLQNIKQKLNITTKSQLIEIMFEHFQ